jgi:hypothetical protein
MEERDHYKYSTNPHYAYNSCDFTPPEISEKHPEIVEYNNEGGNMKIVNEYITCNNTPNKVVSKLKLDLTSEYTKEDNSKSSSKTSRASIINYFKDLFK